MDEENRRQMNMDVDETHEMPAQNERPLDEQAPERRLEPVTERNTAAPDELVPLFEQDAAEKFRTRWLAIQSKFVDDPSESVKQADTLVDDVIQDITRNFADRRGSLERQWNSGGKTSTEDLRIALKQYRSFFNRLLSLES